MRGFLLFLIRLAASILFYPIAILIWGLLYSVSPASLARLLIRVTQHMGKRYLRHTIIPEFQHTPPAPPKPNGTKITGTGIRG